jgi:hypothetical protein
MDYGEWSHRRGAERPGAGECAVAYRDRRFGDGGSRIPHDWMPARLMCDKTAREFVRFFRRLTAYQKAHDDAEKVAIALTQAEGGAELNLYNTRAVDALDQILSVRPRDENGKLTSASRPVFIHSLVEGIDIFNGEILGCFS